MRATSLLNIDLIISLLLPWVFWGILDALLRYAGRSWIKLLLMVAAIAPTGEAL